jgi:hypothetical protein
MPVSETKQPKDAVALHERIRGPSKEEIEAAVAESVRRMRRWGTSIGLT